MAAVFPPAPPSLSQEDETLNAIRRLDLASTGAGEG